MSPLVTLAGSAIVIALMLGVAAALGFLKGARIANVAALGVLLADYEPGARIEDAAIDDKGRAALAKLNDGRVLVARVMGDSVSLRTLSADAMRLSIANGRVSARFADLGFPSLNMALAEPPVWLRALGEKT